MKQRLFLPLLQQFCQETKDVDIGGDFSTIFLPHTMSGYAEAKRKIFYFGRDTYGWNSTSLLMDCFKKNNLNQYISQTEEWINNNGFLEYNNNSPYGFWSLAMRLHLRLKGCNDYANISSDIDDEHLSLLNDFGYGNTNSIEVKDTLKKRKRWDILDKEKYWKVKANSAIFDKLSQTIDAYSPDLVFVFNWATEEAEFLEGLDYSEQRCNLINNHFIKYTLHSTNTTVIWTVHPNNLRFQGYNVDDLIESIVATL